jgi:hypothetical protein
MPRKTPHDIPLYVVLSIKGYAFPVDMLRYDRACPHRERDSGVIVSTLTELRNTKGVKVQILFYGSSINHDRWLSFGWEVTHENPEYGS